LNDDRLRIVHGVWNIGEGGASDRRRLPVGLAEPLHALRAMVGEASTRANRRFRNRRHSLSKTQQRSGELMLAGAAKK